MKSEQDVLGEINSFLEEDGVLEQSDEQSDENSQEIELLEHEPTSAIETLAASYGWKAEGKKSAEDYVKFALEQLPERGEALKEQSAEIKELRTIANSLASHVEKQKQLAYNQAVEDLKNQKREAIENGDVNRYEQLEQLEKNEEVNKVVGSFREKHQEWINGTGDTELEMQAYMLSMDKTLGTKGLPVDQHMALLEDKLLRKFSSYFDKEEYSNKPSAVDSLQSSNVAGKVRSGKKHFSINDLNDEQKSVAKFLDRQGTLKIADYIKQLADAGDLK